jgi:hypothetical protein
MDIYLKLSCNQNIVISCYELYESVAYFVSCIIYLIYMVVILKLS